MDLRTGILICVITYAGAYANSHLEDDSDVAKRGYLFTIGDDTEYYFLNEGEQLPDYGNNARGRNGIAPLTHSCNYVREIPELYRNPLIYGGIPMFYQKFTEAYSIPIISSNKVSDSALQRACYVTRFLLADNSEVRNSFYKRRGRVAVIGHDEDIESLPEYKYLPASLIMNKLRGFGATIFDPISSAGEENLLCFKNADKYPNEDIFLHQMAHGIYNLGAKYAINGWLQRLENQFTLNEKSNLWDGTHAKRTVYEYFAEGVQSFFNDNDFSDHPDGMHGKINTREKLKSYDPALYSLIQEVFPCNNKFLDRCRSNRASEDNQSLRMNCLPSCGIDGNGCIDQNTMCPGWANRGECAINPVFMLDTCKKSCQGNRGQFYGNSDCLDLHHKCQMWAAKGECTKNPIYMKKNCKKSCNDC